MRILHTADWHIGHRLYERSRINEHREFFQWLLETIKANKVDVLIVSGDIFDTTMPATDATDLYYQFLFQLYHETNTQAVITAGNHDSPRRLAAPRKFLKMGRVHVIGGIDSSLDDCIITLHVNTERLSVAAIPYLSESEILPHVSFETKIEKSLRYREAMKQLYHQCVAKMPADIPRILMGHLVLQGSVESGSERIIQFGGAMPVQAVDLPGRVDYVALGHIHRPQPIMGNSQIWYSGSPLPMTFKEAAYDKKVLLLDLVATTTSEVTEFTVPIFQDLCRVHGSFEKVIAEARSTDWTGKYIEVQLALETPRLGAGDEIREEFRSRGGDVLIVEVHLAGQQSETDFSATDFVVKSPEEIFEEFYRTTYSEEAIDESDFAALKETFSELTHLVETQSDK